VYYGIKITWGVQELALRTGAVTVILLVAAAAVYPVIHARRLETAEFLRSA
jgi:putative ABC transport system permease protein